VLFNQGIDQIDHANDGQGADQGMVRIVNSAGDITVGIHGLKMGVLVKFLNNLM
jgi:hypothetical protein